MSGPRSWSQTPPCTAVRRGNRCLRICEGRDGLGVAFGWGRASGRARSPLETLARIQLRAAGLDVADGVVIAGVGEVDLVVDGWLVVELDGSTFHSDPWTFDQDRRRDRELVRRGYAVVRFTSNDVRSGKIVTDVRRAVAARPETGGPRPA